MSTQEIERESAAPQSQVVPKGVIGRPKQRKSRITLVAVVLGLLLSSGIAAPASAAEASANSVVTTRVSAGSATAGLSNAVTVGIFAGSCSSFGTSGTDIIGSCVGNPTFTVHFQCWPNEQWFSRTLYSSSFNFQACAFTPVSDAFVTF